MEVREKVLSSATVSDSLKTAAVLMGKKSTGAFSAHSDALAFRKNMIHTGILEVDLNLRPIHGSRIQILGPAHAGKSVMTMILMGAANKTCRKCITPIIDFINDWTAEVVTTCSCGENLPMRVMLIDGENCFDPAWANIWGVKVDLDFEKQVDESEEGIYVSDDALFTVVRVASIEQAHRVAETVVRDGSVDLLAIDSIAALEPASRQAGNNMIGDQANAITKLSIALVAAQGEAMSKFGFAPTIVMPNQERVNIGGFAMHGTPKMAAGGEALKYNNTITWKLNTKYNTSITNGHKVPNRFGDTIAISKKDKESGGTGGQAAYRVYVDNHKIRNLEYNAGDTDESTKLFGIIKELGAIDERWYKKEGAKITVLGREFTTAQSVNEFLLRPDIVFLTRFPLYSLKFPEHLRKHLNSDRFSYTPFKNDPILQLHEEANLETGRNIEQRTRKHEPAMLGREEPTRAVATEPPGPGKIESEGDNEE